MKNRKKVLIAFVVCAALLMSVGYAALTTTLILDGTAYIKTGAAQDEFEGDVVIYSVSAGKSTDSASIDSGSKDRSATFGINSLGLAGNTATFEVVVESTSVHNAVANVVSIEMDNAVLTITKDENNKTASATSGKISVDCKWVDKDNTLEAGDTTPSYVTLEITFTLLETPQTSHDHTFKITVDATSVE